MILRPSVLGRGRLGEGIALLLGRRAPPVPGFPLRIHFGPAFGPAFDAAFDTALDAAFGAATFACPLEFLFQASCQDQPITPWTGAARRMDRPSPRPPSAACSTLPTSHTFRSGLRHGPRSGPRSCPRHGPRRGDVRASFRVSLLSFWPRPTYHSLDGGGSAKGSPFSSAAVRRLFQASHFAYISVRPSVRPSTRPSARRRSRVLSSFSSRLLAKTNLSLPGRGRLVEWIALLLGRRAPPVPRFPLRIHFGPAFDTALGPALGPAFDTALGPALGPALDTALGAATFARPFEFLF